MAEGGMAELTGDERLLAGLMSGETVVEAAAAAHMPERTARRRVASREFRERLDAGRRELTALVAAQLVSDAAFGRAVLREIAADEDVGASTRVTAARFLISYAFDYSLTRDAEQRIAALEEQLGLDAGSRLQEQRERRLRAAN
jgi:hypothetical protein